MTRPGHNYDLKVISCCPLRLETLFIKFSFPIYLELTLGLSVCDNKDMKRVKQEGSLSESKRLE